jgi:hypothetical protein
MVCEGKGFEASPAFTDKHESPAIYRPTPLRVCSDLADLLSRFVASDRRNHQLHRRVAFIVEDLSHRSSFPRSEMARAEWADAAPDELQPRPHTRSQSRRSVFGLHVPLPVHAPAFADSMERDQGAKEEGLGVRLRDLHAGARTDDPPAGSGEVGREVAERGWNLLAC